MRDRALRVAAGLSRTAVVTGSAGLTCWLVGRTAVQTLGDRKGLWVLGRSAGLTSYAGLTCLVLLGLVLSHPGRSRWSWPSSVARVRLHVGLAVFVLAFTVLHVVVLVLDPWAGVGVRGALVPLASAYRPVPVTLGLLGAYAGLLAGGTAGLAGRIPVRAWWVLHKGSGLAFLLVWGHGVLAGSDSAALRTTYLVSGAVVLAAAAWRYTARSAADRRADMLPVRAGVR